MSSLTLFTVRGYLSTRKVAKMPSSVLPSKSDIYSNTVDKKDFVSDGAGHSPANPNSERLLTPTEVADRLGVSPRWVRDHATRREPRIPSVRLGSLLRFRWSDIAEFLNLHFSRGSSKNSRGG